MRVGAGRFGRKHKAHRSVDVMNLSFLTPTGVSSWLFVVMFSRSSTSKSKTGGTFLKLMLSLLRSYSGKQIGFDPCLATATPL